MDSQKSSMLFDSRDTFSDELTSVRKPITDGENGKRKYTVSYMLQMRYLPQCMLPVKLNYLKVSPEYLNNTDVKGKYATGKAKKSNPFAKVPNPRGSLMPDSKNTVSDRSIQLSVSVERSSGVDLSVTREKTNEFYAVNSSKTMPKVHAASRENLTQRAVPPRSVSQTVLTPVSSVIPLPKWKVRMSSDTIFKEFVCNQSSQDTVIDFIERFETKEDKQKAVENFLESILEKPIYIADCSQIVIALLRAKAVSPEIVVEAVTSFLRGSDNLLYEYPLFWDHTANLLTQLVFLNEDYKLYNELKLVLQQLPDQRNSLLVISRMEHALGINDEELRVDSAQNIHSTSSKCSMQKAVPVRSTPEAASPSASRTSTLSKASIRPYGDIVYREFVGTLSAQDFVTDFTKRYKTKEDKQKAVEGFIRQVLEKPLRIVDCNKIMSVLLRSHVVGVPIVLKAASNFLQKADDLEYQYPKFWACMASLLSEWPLCDEDLTL